MALLGSIAISLALSALARAGNTSCAAGSPTWWNNDLGDTPCKMYENLVGRCEPNFSLFPLEATAYYFCSGTATGLTNNACCCNIATFSILQACIFCQTGVKTLTVEAESYGTFLSSGGACSDPAAIGNQSVLTDVSDLDLSAWAFLPPTGDSYQWNPTEAEANATRALAGKASQSVLSQASQSVLSTASVASVASVSATSSITTSSASGSGTQTAEAAGQSASAAAGGGKGVNGGAVGGAIAGVVLVAAAAIAGWWFWRRRSRFVRDAQAASTGPAEGWNVDDDDDDASRGPAHMAAVSPYVTGAPIVPQTYHSPSVDASMPAPSSSDNRSPLLSPSHSPQHSLATQYNPSDDHHSVSGSAFSPSGSGSQITSPALASSAASPNRASGPPSSISSSGPNARGSGKGPLPGGSAVPTLGYSEEEESYEQEVDAGRLPLPAKPEVLVDRAPPVYDPEWVDK